MTGRVVLLAVDDSDACEGAVKFTVEQMCVVSWGLGCNQPRIAVNRGISHPPVPPMTSGHAPGSSPFQAPGRG